MKNRIRQLLMATLLMMGLPTAAIPVPTNGLVAYYPFNGHADDASGNRHHGDVVGAVPTTDASGESDGAFYFDGSGDHISLSGFLGNPTNGTIAGWVYVESYDIGHNQLNLIFGQNDNLQIGLGDSSTSADGKWIFRMNSGGFKNVIGPLATTGEWTHVTGVWTGTEIILYLNGTETNRVSCGVPGAAFGGSGIGAHPNLSQNYWHGKIDELVIYNRALSEPEILQLAAPAPLRFTDIHAQGSNVVLSVRSLPVGMPASLQRAAVLQPPDWKNAATFFAVDAGTNVTLPLNSGAAFYRVVSGEAVFRDGLALYLLLDGDTIDDSTNQTDGINTGVTFTNDWSGSPTNAAYLDGTGAHIYVPDAPSLDVTNLTLSFWFNVASHDGARELVNKFGVNGNISYGSEIDSGGTLYFRICSDGTTGSLTDLASTSTVSTATWYHFAGTYDGKEMRLYLNGNPESSILKSGSIFNSSSDLRVGRYDYYSGWVFHGSIDEVALWDRCLSESEVTILHLNGGHP